MQDATPSAEPPEPGTQEFASLAKQAFGDRFERTKEGLRGAEGLITVILSCAYDGHTAYDFGCSGSEDDIMNTIACAVVELADRRYAEMKEKEKFLPKGNQSPYQKAVVKTVSLLISTVHQMAHDKNPGGSPIFIPPSAL